jgi:nucleotide-binding universal stress UspA family protein
MYIDARSSGVFNRRAEAELVQAVRAELHLFEHRLRRIQVRVHAHEGQHGCHLLAWSGRGQTISIEKRAGTPSEAVMLAVRSLNHALKRPWASTLPGDEQPHWRESGSARRGQAEAARAASSEVEAGRMSEPEQDRILLALHELEPTASSVHWARVLAGVFGVPLDVCRAVAGVAPPASLPPGPLWLSATRRLLAERRSTRVWCRESLPEAELIERIVLAEGAYVDEMALLARQRGAGWIVVPADRITCGATVAQLARRARCPVLVARPPKTRCTLLIATEGDSNNQASLARAARLSHAFHAPVLAFHNLHACTAAPFVPLVDSLTRPWQQLQADATHARSEYGLPELEVLLSHGCDHVEAILQQARREDADMIVLAVGLDTTGKSRTSDEVVAGVVERAVRSVLVVPDPALGTASRGRVDRRRRTREVRSSRKASTAPERPSSCRTSRQLLSLFRAFVRDAALAISARSRLIP